MKTVLNLMFACCTALCVTACALLQTPAHDEARLLMAWEATQQAILIYGHLPECHDGMARLCRDAVLWQRLKATEAAATSAITAEDYLAVTVAIGEITKALAGAQGAKP